LTSNSDAARTTEVQQSAKNTDFAAELVLYKDDLFYKAASSGLLKSNQ